MLSNKQSILIKSLIKKILKIFAPILVSQIAMVINSTILIIVTGHYNITDLAAVSLGIAILMPLFLFALGLLIAITPIISYLYGAGDHNQISHQVKQGFWIVILLTIFLGLSLYNADILLKYMQLSEVLYYKTYSFLKLSVLGLPGFLLFINFRSLNDGIAKTTPTMVIMLFGLVSGVILTYVCVNGIFNKAIVGTNGAAIAYALNNWLLFLMSLIYVKRSVHHKQLGIVTNFFEKPNPKILKKILKLGLPLAVALCAESSLFDIVAILIAPLGENVIASNQIGLTMSSILFSIPLSLGMAATIIMGQLLGAKKYLQTKTTFFIVSILGLLIAIIAGLLVLIFKTQIVYLFVNKENVLVIKLTSSLLTLLVFLHCFDAMQVISSCTLRAYRDTTYILLTTIPCYWIIGIGIGYMLSLTDLIAPKMGVHGFWLGIIFGLATAAIFLILRILKIQSYSKEKLSEMFNN